MSDFPTMVIRRRIGIVLEDADELCEDEQGETYVSDVDLRVRLVGYQRSVRAEMVYSVGCHVLLDSVEQELVAPLSRSMNRRTITLTPAETEQAMALLRAYEVTDG